MTEPPAGGGAAATHGPDRAVYAMLLLHRRLEPTKRQLTIARIKVDLASTVDTRDARLEGLIEEAAIALRMAEMLAEDLDDS